MPLARCLALVAIICLPVGVRAQLNLFTGVSFEHEVTKRWGYTFEVEHRQELRSGRENRVLLLAAINRQLGDRLNVTPGIRHTPRYGPDGPGEVRFFTDVNYSLPLGDGPFALEGRLRLQHELEWTPDGTVAGSAVRPRVGVAYAANDFLELVAEYEARFRSDLPRSLSRHRWTVGLQQQITSGLSVELFYRIERRTQTAKPDNEPTVGVYLGYVLPDVRDREWKYRRPFGRLLNW